jgi:hypothetical protein
MADRPRPHERLQPGSWTEAEVDAMQGRRVRAAGGIEGTITTAGGLLRPDGAVFQYAVQVLWDNGQKNIAYAKRDYDAGAFELLP